MPISPAFTISQSSLAPNLITATDTSTGSDVDVLARRITFQTPTATYLTESGTTPPNYNEWPLANTSQSFDVLEEDQALRITVQWVNNLGTALYTLTQVYCLAEYNKQFFYYLVEQQALTPTILQDVNYASNMALYWTNIVGAIKAVEIGADISASQNCLNRATDMKQNEAKFF